MTGSLPIGPHQSVEETSPTRTYEVVTGDRYLHGLEDGAIRCWPDRHVFMLNEETGDIVITGDRGTFVGHWSLQMRGGKSLASFLADLNFDYFMKKTAKQPYMVADIDATIGRMRRDLLKDRRDGGIEKAVARDIWETMDLCLDPGQGREEFEAAVYGDGTLYERFSDGGLHVVEVEHAGTRIFWDEVWSVFRRDVLLVQTGAETGVASRAA
jgi:hypothetical protein